MGTCIICKTRPSAYNDGLCSYCKRQQNKEQGVEIKEESVMPGEVVKPNVVEGLISIIIPVYNTDYSLFHYTGHCIGSVREHTDKELTPYELIVVDNGSPVKPPKMQSYYADKVIQNKENLGVTKAWNQAIRASFGEYIVLLNNDAQVYDHWLEDMKEALDSGLDLVMAHPMYSLTEPFARGFEAAQVRKGVKVLDDLERDFACVMFRKDLLNDIGMFDEQFFNYSQDLDMFKRMDKAGKTYRMVDYVAIHHIIGATGHAVPETGDIMTADREKYEEKWKE